MRRFTVTVLVDRPTGPISADRLLDLLLDPRAETVTVGPDVARMSATVDAADPADAYRATLTRFAGHRILAVTIDPRR